MTGLELSAIYSWGCGAVCNLGANELLTDFIKGKISNASEIREVILRLELRLYYFLLAKMNDIDDIFDFRVAETYWLGSELNINNKPDKKAIAELMSAKGMPKRYGSKEYEVAFYLAPLIEGRSFLFHNSTALKTLEIAGKFNTAMMIGNVNNCLIFWGQVLEIKEDNLFVSTQKLTFNKNGLLALSRKKETIKKGFVDAVRTGDWVTLHFGCARQVISERQKKRLAELTGQAVKLFNSKS